MSPAKRFCPFCAASLVQRFVDGRTRLFCESCGQTIYENPTPATCLVVVDPADRLLLVKRSVPPKKGHWCLPGGFMELDETPEEAALRELQEETGLMGDIEILLGVTASPGVFYPTILMMGFLVRRYHGVPTAGDDATDAGYFAPDRLPDIAFQSHRRFVDIYYNAISPLRADLSAPGGPPGP